MPNDASKIALQIAYNISQLAPPVVIESKDIDDRLALFDQLIPDGDIAKASRHLYADGHYRQSVVDGFICLDGLTRRKSKLTASGVGLMKTAFSAASPKLRLNNLTSQSEKDEQQGYMDLFSGAMMAIRNPRAHDHEWHDDAETALQLLHFAYHLSLKIKKSKFKK